MSMESALAWYGRRTRDLGASVVHATLDPQGPGAVRIHLVPPKFNWLRREEWLLILDGWWIFPLGPAWADLLREFLEALNREVKPGEEISTENLEKLLIGVAQRMRRLYPSVPAERFLDDLNEIVGISLAIARGNWDEVPPEVMTKRTLHEYAPNMRAPLRMDLLVMPMQVNGTRVCPLNCKGCYAAEPAMEVDRLLTKAEWMEIIDRCREVGISQLTFTGGEPTENPDLIDLIAYAKWFVTRLNTNGYKMTPKLARQLREASLDGIQLTLLSAFPSLHDELVGRQGAWERTVAGIKYCLEAGLSVSVNTPLVKANADYPALLRFLAELGVRFASCSGLIPTGGAPAQIAKGEALTNAELMEIMTIAVAVANDLSLELSFTSPGWLSPGQLKSLGLYYPYCGACLSNMAVAPNGRVLPCQSWLGDPDGLGSMLKDPWDGIWNHPLCLRLRSTQQDDCPLGEEVRR